MDAPLLVVVGLVSILAGATAVVVGFGIGSLITPLVAVATGMDRAIAAVAIPHAAATVLRAWRLRRSVDRAVLLRFGLLSAAGGLGGALLYSRLGDRSLTQALGVLLLLTAVTGVTGLATRWHPRGATMWLLGLVSGFFGGVAGNQGGLRAAALGAFGLRPTAFVATATAIGVLVDAARTPVYVWRAGADLVAMADLITIATAGTLIGTLLGERVLLGLSPARFRRIVAAAIGALGVWLLLSSWG
jgi:uncharacterized membrane protein YfcA